MYKPINGWTKIKIINHIKKHFTYKSVDHARDVPVYRGKIKGKVTKCAVGLFIPDSKYDMEMEGFSVKKVIVKYDLSKEMPLSKQGMDEFQCEHDYGFTNIKNALIKWVKENVS